MEKLHSLSDCIPHSLLENEFPFLKEECYLDHAGAALCSRTQIDVFAKDLVSNLYSNPHSSSISSKHCTDTIDQVRYKILSHFNTDMNEFSVVFTSGATSSLKLVAETFNFNDNQDSSCSSSSQGDPEQGISGGTFAYLQDNHTSVLGMRETVMQRGAKLRCVRHDEAFKLMDAKNFNSSCKSHCSGLSSKNSLFVYPAQCNFSGLKYPLHWIDICHRGLLNENANTSKSYENWYCMLDAAALVSTSPLDLSVWKPDFVCISFYKIFGFPTGLGALLVRNSAVNLLKKSYYGGGTVLIALSSEPFHVKRPLLHERFEDGTLNFLSIVSLLHGLEAIRRLGSNMKNISLHCYTIARYCYDKLLQLHHANDKPAIILYCDTDFSDASLQGNILNFNVLRHSGDFVGYSEVQALANLHRIHIRTGCFCNPGACQRHLNLTDEQLRHHFQKGHVCGDDVDLVDGQPTGSIRVSFGIYSRLQDVDKLISLIEDCFVLKPVMYKIPETWTEVSQRLMNKFGKLSCNNNINDDEDDDDDDKDEATDVYFDCVDYKKSEEEQENDNNKKNQISHSSEMGVERSCENFGFDCGNEVMLEKIFIYPVKSCAAMLVDIGWSLDSRGFKYDRQWMVVSETGVALTQKTETLLCLVHPHLSLDSDHLILSAFGKSDCCVPILNDESGSGEVPSVVNDISICQSKVCGDRISAVDCGDKVAAWLSDVLNRSGVRLVRQHVDDKRISRHFNKPQNNGKVKNGFSGDYIDNMLQLHKPLLSLSNQAQFLLINLSTVMWLAEQLPPDSDCDKETLLYRFRSNFVVYSRTLKAFDEQNWSKVQIGGKLFEVIGPCTRCQMICIDQFTGKRTKEPLTTLASCLRGKLQFGVYLQRITKLSIDDADEKNYVEHLDNFITIGDKITCLDT